MILRIAWANVVLRPLTTLLSLMLLTFGVSIVSLAFVLNNQLQAKFADDLAGTDLVLGAKGSPLQLVLSAVYHLDAPPGNISLAEAETFMNNPAVKQAIPLSYGDSYQGYRILGTIPEYLTKYDGTLAAGRSFEHAMEAVVGAGVARLTGLKVGDVFVGAHGELVDGDVHAAHPYTVVGELELRGNVLDRLIITPLESVWRVHDHGHADLSLPDQSSENNHGDDHYDHDHHDTDHDHKPLQLPALDSAVPSYSSELSPLAADDREITAVLLSYRSRRSVFTMPRLINQNATLQAVLPGLEINRLFYLLGIGTDTLRLIAFGIMFVAGCSIFLVLYHRLLERKHELALLRVAGYSRFQLFMLPLVEGLLLTLIGYLCGLLLSRLALWWLNQRAGEDFKLVLDLAWQKGEFVLLLLTLLLGSVAALLPAWRSMHVDVATVLGK